MTKRYHETQEKHYFSFVKCMVYIYFVKCNLSNPQKASSKAKLFCDGAMVKMGLREPPTRGATRSG